VKLDYQDYQDVKDLQAVQVYQAKQDQMVIQDQEELMDFQAYLVEKENLELAGFRVRKGSEVILLRLVNLVKKENQAFQDWRDSQVPQEDQVPKELRVKLVSPDLEPLVAQVRRDFQAIQEIQDF
jgi:hypothetical protein